MTETITRPLYNATLSSASSSQKDATTSTTTSTPPKQRRVVQGVLVQDGTRASQCAEHIRSGKQLIYQGTFPNAERLYAALRRRYAAVVHPSRTQKFANDPSWSILDAWRWHRQHQRREAAYLNSLLVQVHGTTHALPHLKRVPNTNFLAQFDLTPPKQPHLEKDDKAGDNNNNNNRGDFLIPFRQVLVRRAAHALHRNGVYFPAPLEDYIYPHFNVFTPRLDVLELVAEALDAAYGTTTTRHKKNWVAMDVGIGTGALTALLLKKRKGLFQHVWGTDNHAGALACAEENLTKMGLFSKVTLLQTKEDSVFPPPAPHAHQHEGAHLLVCNPPWLPPDTSETLMDVSVFDASQLLQKFVRQAQHYLRSDEAEAWLIMSNLAELLQLRPPDHLPKLFDQGDLEVVDVVSRPATAVPSGNQQAKVDPRITQVKAQQVISLYRLRRRRKSNV